MASNQLPHDGPQQAGNELSEDQISDLEASFAVCRRPNSIEVAAIAEFVGISRSMVIQWHVLRNAEEDQVEAMDDGDPRDDTDENDVDEPMDSAPPSDTAQGHAPDRNNTTSADNNAPGAASTGSAAHMIVVDNIAESQGIANHSTSAYVLRTIKALANTKERHINEAYLTMLTQNPVLLVCESYMPTTFGLIIRLFNKLGNIGSYVKHEVYARRFTSDDGPHYIINTQLEIRKIEDNVNYVKNQEIGMREARNQLRSHHTAFRDLTLAVGRHLLQLRQSNNREMIEDATRSAALRDVMPKFHEVMSFCHRYNRVVQLLELLDIEIVIAKEIDHVIRLRCHLNAQYV